MNAGSTQRVSNVDLIATIEGFGAKVQSGKVTTKEADHFAEIIQATATNQKSGPALSEKKNIQAAIQNLKLLLKTKSVNETAVAAIATPVVHALDQLEKYVKQVEEDSKKVGRKGDAPIGT